VRVAARALLVSVDVALLSAPRLLQPSLGDHAFLATTIVVLVANVALVATWRDPAGSNETRESRVGWVVAIAAGVIIFAACRAWLHEILIYPHDSQRADMLVLIQHGIRRLLDGQNPYTIYQVPWDAPLVYGPMLWGPFTVPHLVGADVRFFTILGALFIATFVAVVAVGQAQQGRHVAALGAVTLLAAIAFSPDLRGFMSIGHTTVYWPLLAVFAWLVAGRRWEAAAVTAGLLVVARTTMVALVPVLMMAIWYDARHRFMRAAVMLAAAVAIPFLPFAVWDWPALWYGLYGSYQHTMKGFVWVSTDWVQHTIGITGPLLSAGLGRAVEAVQGVTMIGVYGAAWLAIRRARPALPWMGLALLVFSMTTLWPVFYIYFDVFVLFACGALASREAKVARTSATMLGVAALVLMATTWVSLPAEVTIDAGTGTDRPYLYAGFANDERGERTFAWIVGTHAKMLVPARARREAVIVIHGQPHLPDRGVSQQLIATLNGTLLDTITLGEGWQDILLHAPARAWRIGANELDLFLSMAVSPAEAGSGSDTRRLSLAVDRLTVRGR
jgi:hypothetical protein